MRMFFTVLALLVVSAPAVSAEPYRVTPYFECIVGKGVAQKVLFDATADEAMDAALKACASADPGKPPSDQDAVDNREYMRVVAYDVILHAEPFEARAENAP